MEELYLTNYCNPNCTPLQSITRLPEEEAYRVAKTLSDQHQGAAFYRFADFIHYYPRRIRTEEWLHRHFLAMGGKPETRHPLYFVLEGSDYLAEWFGRGPATRLSLRVIDPAHISFTLGDSMAKMDRPERRDPLGKAALLAEIGTHGGIGAFLASIAPVYTYVEAQLWNDCYIMK